jgi:hypothetical protein
MITVRGGKAVTLTARAPSLGRAGRARYIRPMSPQKTYVEASWADLWPLIT